MLAAFLFQFSFLVLFYTYFGFILILIIRGMIRSRPYKSGDVLTDVSVVIAAYNEAENIKDRIENLLASDYPQERMEILIVSDGSDDGTNEIVKQYTQSNIKLLELPRGGKATALNTAVPQATGEILVFSDANTEFAPDAIHQLVRPFADEQVGGVAGDQQYIKERGTASNSGENLHWNLDRFLKKMESNSGNVISATGAIYAIRRKLYDPIPTGATDDFYISTSVIKQGYRLVFNENAIAYEYTASSNTKEYKRKVRIIIGGLYGVIANRELLNPAKYGFYALQLFTHKVLRRLMFIPFIVIFFSNLFLFQENWFYFVTMVAQVAFYGAAFVGLFLEQRNIRVLKLLSIPSYIVMTYVAAMMASWTVLQGQNMELWSTKREQT